MKPTWSADPARFEEELRAWELRVERYESVTGVPVPDQIRCATVSQHAPQAVKVFLRLVPQDYLQNYQLLREAIVTYLSRGRVYSAEGASLNTWAQTVPVPMEIDVVTSMRSEVEALTRSVENLRATQRQFGGKPGGKGKLSVSNPR